MSLRPLLIGVLPLISTSIKGGVNNSQVVDIKYFSFKWVINNLPYSN